MLLTPEDGAPFYHAFPEYLRNEDVEKCINIEDTEVQEAIVDNKIILFQGVLDYGGLNWAHINQTMG